MFPPSFPISGSVHVTPRFPPAGPDGHGSPPSAVLSGRYDFLLRLSFGLLIRQPGPQAPAGFVFAVALPPPCRADRGPGLYCSRWPSLLQRTCLRARAGSPRFPDDPSVVLRRSTTPDDPWRLTCDGAAGAAPSRLTLKASSIAISRLTPPLRHPLSTLHDLRCRKPCKTRFRLAGCAFAGREFNPLGRSERFQFLFLLPFQDLSWRNKHSLKPG